MDDDKKRKFKVILVVCCFVLAGAIFLMTRPKSPGSGSAKRAIQMLCVNEECNAEYEISSDEFREMMQTRGPGAMMMPGMGPQAFTCDECGEESAFMATKCGQCGFVFVPTYDGSDDFPDRCPECDYSAIEEKSGR